LKSPFIWFDMGYTLVYMQRERTYRQALRHFGHDISIEDLEREFHLTDKLFMREYPGVFLKPRGVYMPWFLGTLNYRLGISVDVCKIDKHWHGIQREVENYWLPFDGVHETLETLKQASCGLGIISNWDHTARDILNSAELSEYFDHIITSYEVNCKKPDPEIFQIALDRAGVSAAECIYVGDNYYDDAVGSRAVGMQALIVNRFGRLGIEEIEDCPVIQHISQVAEYIQPAGQDKKGVPADL
jgi:putative hydrolase of the HAD superfamily